MDSFRYDLLIERCADNKTFFLITYFGAVAFDLTSPFVILPSLFSVQPFDGEVHRQ